MKEEVPLPEKISASFQQLAAAATELNAVSDELGKAIGTLDGVLQHLNLGVSTWLFNDAPRALRVDAIDKLPDLLEQLPL